MSKFIPFAEVLECASIDQIARQMLHLPLQRSGSQFRCSCPVHRGDDRTLAVTPNKMSRGKNPSLGVFFCQVAEDGGDRIALVAHVLGCSMNEAAHRVSEFFGGTPAPARPSPAAQPQPESSVDRLKKVGDALVSTHEDVQKLGIEPETAVEWGIGYKPTGMMIGRVLFPIRDREGIVRGYCGHSETKQPHWQLPDNIDPTAFIFGAEKLEEGDVRIVADPLKVVLRYQKGSQAVCFLTESAGPIQAEMLASLLDTKKCEWDYK